MKKRSQRLLLRKGMEGGRKTKTKGLRQKGKKERSRIPRNAVRKKRSSGQREKAFWPGEISHFHYGKSHCGRKGKSFRGAGENERSGGVGEGGLSGKLKP